MNNIASNLNINWVPGLTLDEVEKQCILKALQWFRGNKSQTAIALGITVKTIDNKLEKYEAEGKVMDDKHRESEIKRAEILNRMRGIQPAQKLEEITPELNAGTRPRMESPTQVAAKYGVPVPERKEVQNVLPRQVAQSSKRR